jgi:hypothetical protein
VDPIRITFIADDQRGIRPPEVENVLSQCARHKLLLAELAFDFNYDTGVDEQFVRWHGRFGKSRLSRGKAGQPRFGSRASPKMVRLYHKPAVSSFRVEIEAHRALIRKYSDGSVRGVGSLAWKLSPGHIEFVAIRWPRLRLYLVRKFGEVRAESILQNASDRAERSLQEALRYLAANRVFNAHRFLRPMALDQEVRTALRRWARWWTDRMQTDVEMA